MDVQPQQMGNIDRRVENSDLGSTVTVQTQQDLCRLISSSTLKVWWLRLCAMMNYCKFLFLFLRKIHMKSH